MPHHRCFAGRRLLVLTAVAGCAWMAGCVKLPGLDSVEGAVRVVEPERSGRQAPIEASLPLTIDNNRLFAEVSFRRGDGSERKALAWVNMGMAAISVTPSLEKELGGGGPIQLVLAGLPVSIDRKAMVTASAADFAQQFGPMPVEATIPAGVLSQFCVNLNY